MKIQPAGQACRAGGASGRTAPDGRPFRQALPLPAPAHAPSIPSVPRRRDLAVAGAAAYVAQQIGQIMEEDDGAGLAAHVHASDVYGQAGNVRNSPSRIAAFSA